MVNLASTLLSLTKICRLELYYSLLVIHFSLKKIPPFQMIEKRMKRISLQKNVIYAPLGFCQLIPRAL